MNVRLGKLKVKRPFSLGDLTLKNVIVNGGGYERGYEAGYEKGETEGYDKGEDEALDRVNEILDSVKGYTVTIQYIYNCSPVYISKHYPKSEDDYDVVLPKTNDFGDNENRPTDIKSVVIENVNELYFWENDEDPSDWFYTNQGLCVLRDGKFLIYNHYSDKCGFNDTTCVPDGEWTEIIVPALDKNNFAVTEDMTITIDHVYD